MEKHNINYWVYPGLSYNIYDANSAMKAVSQVFNISEEEIKSIEIILQLYMLLKWQKYWEIKMLELRIEFLF